MRHSFGSILLAALLLAGCGDDGDDGGGEDAADGSTTTTATSTTAAPTTTAAPGTTTTTVPVEPGGTCPDPFAGSSTATFDEAAGQYAVDVVAVSAADGTIDFDVVQWLVGDEADEAYEAETGDSSGVPNDYFILNESEQVRTAPVKADADIQLLDRVSGDVTGTLPGTLEELAALDFANPFWLTFASGTIVGVCEQYVP